MTWLAIDFEASCLPVHGRSFPIEVGIAADGRAARSWLIRPAPEWHDWCWTAEAEALHGISREALFAEGLPPGQVLRELTATVGEARLFADSDFDRGWLRTLADAARVASPLWIDHIATLLDPLDPPPHAVQDAMAHADRHVSRRHRAGEDARWIAAFIARLTGAPEFDRTDLAIRFA